VTVDPFAPAALGPITLRNRIIKAATFEGMSPNGVVTPNLIDYHRAVATGGVAMTTLAYCAVSKEGRGAPGEIVVREEALPGLRAFVDAMHATGAAASMQLGHAGPVAANASNWAVKAAGASQCSSARNTALSACCGRR